MSKELSKAEQLAKVEKKIKKLYEKRNQNSAEILHLKGERVRLNKEALKERFPIEPGYGTVLRFYHKFPGNDNEYAYTAVRTKAGWLTTSRKASNLPTIATWDQLRRYMRDDRVEFVPEWAIAPEGEGWRDLFSDRPWGPDPLADGLKELRSDLGSSLAAKQRALINALDRPMGQRVVDPSDVESQYPNTMTDYGEPGHGYWGKGDY